MPPEEPHVPATGAAIGVWLQTLIGALVLLTSLMDKIPELVKSTKAAYCSVIDCATEAEAPPKTEKVPVVIPFYAGEYNQSDGVGQRLDPRNYSRDPATMARAVCEQHGLDYQAFVTVRVHDGNCCGYGWYNTTCLQPVLHTASYTQKTEVYSSGWLRLLVAGSGLVLIVSGIMWLRSNRRRRLV